MQTTFATIAVHQQIAEITLNDPSKRNALGLKMFDELDAAIASLASNMEVHVALLRGEGSVFCAGFDLAAAAGDPSQMAEFIMRLSEMNRRLRRLPHVVVAAVQGAAIAGGCAILSACDFVFAARDAKFGYPVHRIGVSPAVTIPTLQQAVGPGAARSLLMSGELIDAAAAHRIGLVSHLSESGDTVLSDARAHCTKLATKGPHALRATKAWLNEIDGSLNDAAFVGPARASAEITQSAEAQALIATWNAKRP